MIGVPSVYAAGIAQRTRRIRIGYAVAVIPLHHPLRLAEEISWVDHLSKGRLLVGLGPGFSPFEFDRFGISIDQRHTRFAQGLEVVCQALVEPEIMFQGQRLTIHPRPYTRPHPPFYLASTADESLRTASPRGMSILLGTESLDELTAHLKRYRAIRMEENVAEGQIDREIGEMYVLRRICVAETDDEARRDVEEPLRWHREMGTRVHQRGELIDIVPTIVDDSPVNLEGGCIGGVATVIRQLDELRALGLRKVIGWFRFGNMPHASVCRSMELIATKVIPRIAKR